MLLTMTGYSQPGSLSSDAQIDRLFQVYQDRMYTESLHLIEQILKEKPHHPQLPVIQTILANVYFQLGKYQSAYQTLEQFIQLYPDHPNRANAYFLLGTIENLRFHYLPAAEFYLQAYRSGQTDPNLITRIDQSLHELIIEKLEIEELIRLAENSDAPSFRNSIYFSIADRYTRNFDFPKAIGYWEKIDSQADSPEARARLEQCRNAMMAPLRIGLIGPLSGEYSSYGSAMIRG
ncbi:MAG: tetratricopeptide repeat protein, partial [Candidatus Delongbacteria bacterium]|nr:tetratricopeptide repeat protein [Candidatus Delongbacteria bacterium]